MMMYIFGWILFGFVVGLIARAVMPGNNHMSFVGTAFLGMLGAVLAGWIGEAVGWYAPNEGTGFVSATLGAIIVLAVYYAIMGRRYRAGRISSVGSPTKPSDRDRWAA